MSPAQPLRPGEGAERWGAVVVALGAAILLALVKLGTALATGSLAVFASFLDSVMDIFSSTVNAVAIRIAARPADADHAYGHGKAESLAGLFQGVVIGASSAALLVESIRRLIVGAAVAHEALGIAVMAFSIVVTGLVVWRLRRALRRADSITLRAEWAHYAGDFVVNGAALGALAVQLRTGVHWLDPAVSAVLALWLVRAGWGILRESVDVLMDREPAPADVAERISAALASFAEIAGFHSLRTRRSGTLKFVDLHLDIDRALSFARAHTLAEQAGRAIEAAIPGTTVWVHADPYPPDPGDVDDPPTDRRLLRAPQPARS